MDELVRRLLTSEDRAVTEVMAFMSYNPSIGRVFEKRGVAKFQEIMTSAVDKLVKVQCEADFDKLHRECVSKVVKKIKTSRNRRPSWGQGQKAVNVFFKVYVDWARKPNDETRERLLPHLHVPLDRIVMSSIKEEYSEDYESIIKPLITTRTQEFSLSKIDEKLYSVWQRFFREKCPKKPLVFDLIWATKRGKLKKPLQ